MALLPYLGETDNTENWTSVQIWSFAICNYLIVLLFAMGIALAVHNLYQFLKFSETGSKCNPMLLFYIWIISDFICNITWLLTEIKCEVYADPLSTYAPATFKVVLGI